MDGSVSSGADLDDKDCPKCGHNLNQGECGCDTFVPDPRFAGLADIMKQLEQ